MENMEITLPIKAMTVNQCWRGRRYKTKKYEEYERQMNNLLPNNIIINDKHNLKVDVEFGISKLMDIDNGLKPLIDILQKKYKFNDRYIMELNIKKTIVKKTEHFIKVKFEYL